MSSKKNINKRRESIKEYLDELSKKYSKLNIIRVDLGYVKPHSDNVSIENCNDDVKRMLDNRRSKPSVFKEQVGYICKREFTKDKGVHVHAVFIFDGQKVQKDSYKAQQIGEYWQELTDNKGSYHNCHRNKYERNGIGIIDYKDTEKRKILDEDVLSYLCKDDQDIGAIKDNKKSRAFTRGTLPKSKKKMGRPRC